MGEDHAIQKIKDFKEYFKGLDPEERYAPNVQTMLLCTPKTYAKG